MGNITNMLDDRVTLQRIAVIIPTLDEADSIAHVLAAVPSDLVDEILVADSGSTDGTTTIARRIGAHVLDVGRGYGRACNTAAIAAEHADILVFMDGDGADDPALISRLIAPIQAGTHDFVIGSRVRGRAEHGSMAWHQRLVGHLLGGAMRILYGVRYSDMCAYRAIRRDALLALGMREMTYGWNLEMQMRTARAGLRILEVPVDNRRRIGGSSKVAGSFRGTVRAGSRIVATFVRLACAPASRIGTGS